MNHLIPTNEKGKSVDLEYTVADHTEEEAKKRFACAKQKLGSPGEWHTMTGSLSAGFELRKMEVNSRIGISVNDYIRISLPAPGSAAGDGFDWVRVEEIQENIFPGYDESYGLTLKVADNPDKTSDEIAHFLEEDASSTFIIKRKGKEVFSEYHGRNEKVNTDNKNLSDKIRNTVVALGALAGISELQWKAFIKGLIE